MERHEQLRSRVVDDRVSIAWMARRLNVAQSSAAALLRAERMSVKRHGRLARIGMPEEFLPGRKMRSGRDVRAWFPSGNRMTMRQPHAEQETGFDYGKSHKSLPCGCEVRAFRPVCRRCRRRAGRGLQNHDAGLSGAEGHKFNQDPLTLVQAAGRDAPLKVIGRTCGCVFIRLPEVGKMERPMPDSMAASVRQFGYLLPALGDALRNGVISRMEAGRITKEDHEALEAVMESIPPTRKEAE